MRSNEVLPLSAAAKTLNGLAHCTVCLVGGVVEIRCFGAVEIFSSLRQIEPDALQGSFIELSIGDRGK